MSKLTQPLKWHGGKGYLAKKIVELMPRHIHYVEPYAGGAAVLLERDPDDEKLWLPPNRGVSEVLNDLNGELMNFWKVLQSQELFGGFSRTLQAVPLARQAWDEASHNKLADDDIVGRAVAFFVRCRQSRAGGLKAFTSLTRSRLRRGINGNVSEWLGAVDGLAEVHNRLRPVVLENMPAIDLIFKEDSRNTFFYLDPPYLHETRTANDDYAWEMSDKDHLRLLSALAVIKGNFLLSGYRSEMYDEAAKAWAWTRHDFDLPNNAAGGETKRRMTECLWANYEVGA